MSTDSYTEEMLSLENDLKQIARDLQREKFRTRELYNIASTIISGAAKLPAKDRYRWQIKLNRVYSSQKYSIV